MFGPEILVFESRWRRVVVVWYWYCCWKLLKLLVSDVVADSDLDVHAHVDVVERWKQTQLLMVPLLPTALAPSCGEPRLMVLTAENEDRGAHA